MSSLVQVDGMLPGFFFGQQDSMKGASGPVCLEATQDRASMSDLFAKKQVSAAFSHPAWVKRFSES
jgi:hypothetical protein